MKLGPFSTSETWTTQENVQLDAQLAMEYEALRMRTDITGYR